MTLHVPIRLRIFLGILLVVGVGFAFLLDWIVDDLSPRYRESTEEPLVDTARILAALAAATAIGDQLDSYLFRTAFDEVYAHSFTARIYDSIKTRVDFRVYMTDTTGIVVFDSDLDPFTGKGRAEGLNYAAWRDVYLTLRGQYGARTSRMVPEDPLTSVMYVAAPILVHGEIIGVLSVGKPTRNVNQLVASARRKILLAGTATCVAVIIIGLIMSDRLLHPVRRLTAYAQAIRDGQRATLPPLGRSEIRPLGQAFEEMRDALEGKQYVERYVQTLTHEVKSPLAAIQGAVELLQEGVPPAQREQFLSNIHTEAQRIHAIIEKLLMLSSLENRKTIQEVETINLFDLLQEVRASLQPLLTARTQHCELGGDPVACFPGERFLVRQAVANLLYNAIEFTPCNGRITATVEQTDTRVELVVRDTGPGIPAYATGRIFERFYSLPRPDTGKKSSGLGLSLVHEVALLHGGLITLTNAPDGGAVARLTFRRSLAI